LHLVVLGREAHAEEEVLPLGLGEVLQADQVILRVILLAQAQPGLLVVRLQGKLVPHAEAQAPLGVVHCLFVVGVDKAHGGAEEASVSGVVL